MKCISAVTIGKLIEAHMEHDEEKFLAYANFIADAYEESGEERSAKIIRSKISGKRKTESRVTVSVDLLINLLKSYISQSEPYRAYPYTLHDGRRYEGTVYFTEKIGLHDGRGNKIEFR